MTEKQVRDLFIKWKKRLGLDNWQIAIEFLDEIYDNGEICNMQVRRAIHYDHATVKVSKTILNAETITPSIQEDLVRLNVITLEQFIEEIVVHELLHLHMRDIARASDLVREDIHPTTRNAWDNAFTHAEEQLVNRLAISLVGNWV